VAEVVANRESYEKDVEKALHRLRVEKEARLRLLHEGIDPAPPFDAGLLKDISERPPEPLWRINEILPADGSLLVVAQRKTGKTTLMLNAARSLLTGEPFLNRFPCRAATGTVAILNFEVSGSQLAKWAQHVGVPPDGLMLVNLRGRRNPLNYEEDRQQLAALLRDQGVESLIIDPFGQAFHGKSQNDAGEVGAWLAGLDVFARSEVGAHDVILTAHAGWNGERTRGSSALEGWADSVVTMTFGADNQTRYLRAIGRDVGVDEDRLSFDPETRLMAMTGGGSRKQAIRVSKAETLVQPVCDVVRENPGISTTDLVGAVRALRSGGVVTIAFQDNDVRQAVNAAVAQRFLRREALGSGKPIKHYIADPVQAQPSAAKAGRTS
jgi:hypothetical protein